MSLNVDTLKLATQLEAGGFTAQQARTFATALGEAAEVADLVTKADLRLELQTLRSDLQASERGLRSELQLLEQRMTIRLGGMLVVMTGVLAALMRFVH